MEIVLGVLLTAIAFGVLTPLLVHLYRKRRVALLQKQRERDAMIERPTDGSSTTTMHELAVTKKAASPFSDFALLPENSIGLDYHDQSSRDEHHPVSSAAQR